MNKRPGPSKGFVKTKQPISSKDMISGLSVEVTDGNFDKAFRKFNKKVQDSGILREMQDRKFYETPSEVKQKNRKQAKARAKARARRQLRENSLPKKH